jgi:hypothetical protein
MIEFLYAALHSEFGVIVRSVNPKLLRQRLYAARKTDPALACLSITTSPEDERDLWIVKTKGAQNGNAEEP